MSEICFSDDECPYLYICKDLECVHKSIFPLQAYPIFVYCLMPICSGLVNFTGNSMGIFKVLLLMTMLRYNVTKATTLIQAMVFGTALPNFFSIIFKRHPTQQTSLVNYDIVYVFLPCSLYGSTIGSLLQSFIPEIVQNGLIVILFSYFAYRFYIKIKTIKNALKQKKLLEQSLLMSNLEQEENKNKNENPNEFQRCLSVRSHDEMYRNKKNDTLSQRNRYKKSTIKQSFSSYSSEQKKHILRNQVQRDIQIDKHVNPNDSESIKSCKDQDYQITPEIEKQQESQKQQEQQEQQQNLKLTKIYSKIQSYQKSKHVFDIIISFVVFVFFEFFVFLLQGKLPFYQISKCSINYILGLIGLTVLIVGYLFLINRYLQRKFGKYEKVNYPKDLRLKSKRLFLLVCVGGLFSGVVQGILGVGSGTSTMAVLLYLNINPRAATATSGYQILFIGMASLLQLLITNEADLIQTVFLIGVCSILGGLFTYLGNVFFSRFEPIKLNKILVMLMLVLCLISVILVLPSVYFTWHDFGFYKLITIDWKC